MHGWKATVLIIAGAGLLAGTLFYATRPTDPVYKGKRLSAYLTAVRSAGLHLGYNWSWWDEPDPIELGKPHAECRFTDEHALEAVSHVGTNALPLLIRMLKTQEPLAQRWLRHLSDVYPPLQRFIRLKTATAAFEHPIAAVAAFQELGPKAAPVIPDLLALMQQPQYADRALASLIAIRPEAEPDILSLTNALRVRKGGPDRSWVDYFHAQAILALSTYGPRASAAVPLLVQTLNSTNGFVQGASAVALARIGGTREELVPVMLSHLKTNSPPLGGPSRTNRMLYFEQSELLQMSLWSLGQFGSHAAAALPVLSNFQSYPEDKIQVIARHAANRIKADLKPAALTPHP